MEEIIDTRTALLRHVREVHTRLVDLACEDRRSAAIPAIRARGESMVADIQLAFATLNTLSPVAGTKYVGHWKAIVPVLLYLDERGQSATSDEIVDAVVAGGFRGAVAGTASNVQRSLSSYLTGQHSKAKVLRAVGDQIGRHEWDDSYFNSKQA